MWYRTSTVTYNIVKISNIYSHDNVMWNIQSHLPQTLLQYVTSAAPVNAAFESKPNAIRRQGKDCKMLPWEPTAHATMAVMQWSHSTGIELE